MEQKKQSPQAETTENYIRATLEEIVSEYKSSILNYTGAIDHFERFNNEWKTFCYKICQRQKIVTPNYKAFENRIKREENEVKDGLMKVVGKTDLNEFHFELNGQEIKGVISIEYVEQKNKFTEAHVHLKLTPEITISPDVAL